MMKMVLLISAIVAIILGALFAPLWLFQILIIALCCAMFVVFIGFFVVRAFFSEEPWKKQQRRDPVHCDEETGQWYFWEETWAHRQGPFGNEAAARFALKSYVKNVLEAI